MVNKVTNVMEPETLTEVYGSLPKRKVGILGGTFNPPHLGHLVIAEQVKDQLDLEEILFIPSAEPPHKKEKQTIDGQHRLTMLSETIKSNQDFKIEELELRRGGKSFTHDTVYELKNANPEVDYYFIIGADMVQDLKNWYKIEELLNMVQFVSVNRPSHSMNTRYPVIAVDVPNIDISSTLIRQKVSDQCSIRYLVSEEVEKYIESEGLYKNE